jgi:hypothetical protein
MPETKATDTLGPLGSEALNRLDKFQLLREARPIGLWSDKPDVLFRALNTLRGAAWKNFESRRNYEWKFSFGIWTALALACGALLTNVPEPVRLEGSIAAFWITIGIVLVVCVIHGGWTYNCKVRNDRDRHLSYVYEQRMCDLVGVDYETEVQVWFPRDHPRHVAPVSPATTTERWWHRATLERVCAGLMNYWHLSHLLVTIALAVATAGTMWMRVNSSNPETGAASNFRQSLVGTDT